jgi:lysophospholipase
VFGERDLPSSLVMRTPFCPASIALAGMATAASLSGRMLPNAPSGGYAPKAVDCPSTRPSIRLAGELSEQESSWLRLRRNATKQPMADFLQGAHIPGFDAAAFLANASAQPVVGIAVSGGGYRALLNGAGFIAAADARTPGAMGDGGIGGLLQATTYVSGLSGGGWLVGSMYANNFSSVVTLRDGSPGSDIWRFDNSVFDGPDDTASISLLDTPAYWGQVADQVASKKDAGFNTSITDYWGRALSYQLINGTNGGPAYTFSSIADQPGFQEAGMPLPLLVALGRAPGTTVLSVNSTVYEFSPFELGSWDPTTYGFAPLKYLASNFSDGAVPSDGSCVAGFDNAGFVMGTSSSLFNTFLLANISSLPGVPSIVIDALTSILEVLGEGNNDIAQYTPNPFRGWRPGFNRNTNSTELSLVDGGEDLQNIPLHPLLQPTRGVDVIFAIDSSADTTTNWPNGTALRATYDRSKEPIANGTSFPAIPSANTFINTGLSNRPTFFGCNKDASGGTYDGPLIVYVPNAPYTALSNVSTFDFDYPRSRSNDVIRNGYDGATQGNGTRDANWRACVACAVLARPLALAGAQAPSACADCFQRYCWNGTVDDRAPPGPYEPGFIITNQTTTDSESAADGRAPGGPDGAWLALVVGVAGLLAL